MKFASYILILGFVAFSCTEKELDPKDPKKSYGIAKEPYDDANYDRAVVRLGEFKSRFPYSQYTVEAELLIADSYFRTEKFPEAAAAYEQFTKLHPKHAKVDFAMFRIGESYWQDSSESINRDQEYTQKAIDEWKKLIEKMPSSSYVGQAKELIAQGRRRLAESLQFSAHFYCKRSIYHACAYRYLKLIELYPEFKDLTQDALEETTSALDHVADQKDKDPESDKNLFFKTMSSAQIREKSNNLKKLIK